MKWEKFGKRGKRLMMSDRAKTKIRINSITLSEYVHLANSSISSLKITINLSVKDDVTGTLKILVDENVVKTFSNVSSSGDYEFTTVIPAKNNGEYSYISAEVSVEEKTISTNVGILFIGKTYGGGIVTGNSISDNDIKTSPEIDVKDKIKGVYEYSTNDTNGRFFYAYPTVLKKVIKITDESGTFDYTNSVTREIRIIDGYEYEVIYLTDEMIFENLRLKFE